MLFFELNQWDYWLTPDSIFRSIITIVYIKYIFNDNFSIKLVPLLFLIFILSSFRMEAIIYFLPILIVKYLELSKCWKIFGIIFSLLILIPICYGVTLMMNDTYNLGLISGGSENPKEFINYLKIENFNNKINYAVSLYVMRFFSIIIPISPSWSFAHITYNLGLYILILTIYIKKIKYTGVRLTNNWLSIIYILLVIVQVCFVVDPTLRYMYTIYLLIILYIVKNSELNYNEKN
jgi:hypothetical protein